MAVMKRLPVFARRVVLAMLTLVFVAVAAMPASATEARGAFVVTALGDTIALERYERTGGHLNGVLVFRLAAVRFDYRVGFGPGGTVRDMQSLVRPASASLSTAPTQSALMTWQGDSVLADVTPGKFERLKSRPGSIPYINPSIALLEVIVRRALATTPPLDTVPVFAVSGGRTIPARLQFVNPESVVVSMGSAAFELRIARDGTLLSGGMPAQMVVFHRADSLSENVLRMAPPDHSGPVGAPYTSETVRIPTRGGFELEGTLTWSKRPGRLPCVVAITGSGAQDRDGAISLVKGYRPFWQIADTLARRGIAMLRMDDRGFGASGGRFAGSTSADFANDIEDALRWLRTVKDIDSTRLALLGHSEGGLIAPLIATRGAVPGAKLRAMVLMAGPAWTGRHIMQSQNEYALRERMSGAALDSTLALAMHQVDSLSLVEPWIGFIARHDPVAVARRMSSPPVLVLQGETDRQVTQEQAAELAAAFRVARNRDVTVRVLPATNHLFLTDPSGNPAGYSSLPNVALAPATLGAIADWLAS